MAQFEEADSKVSVMEGMLADIQDMLQEETCQKLGLQSKLRVTKVHADSCQD